MGNREEVTARAQAQSKKARDRLREWCHPLRQIGSAREQGDDGTEAGGGGGGSRGSAGGEGGRLVAVSCRDFVEQKSTMIRRTLWEVNWAAEYGLGECRQVQERPGGRRGEFR